MKHVEIERLVYATAETALGTVLVARDSGAIRAILIGDDAEAVRAELATQFGAGLIEDEARLRADLTRVRRHIENPNEALDLALTMHGTSFQKRVWAAIRQVPVGSTITYTELAQRIGAPQAVRAVGSACAANVTALAIPCHRVIRSDGTLASYRWGVNRKRRLLDLEAAA
ncbi:MULTISPECIES: methylated-DNA--[protein]-cysteine S-methyltransferase [unclassified Beijerinckia]|uniref:methylated-DNA--[protein]-cysteine S-methyltransferase n=1 Tax=unclassified Beijerinckia TaxID=2638183 RepID=UPI0008961990|nr:MULTISPECIES: methylated-DNA--[protein]-cysteine S-methyltransferase [unclassified Beijerinckia]MDH7794639.1 O-6-methylguanine DNA methyltransferase [Beijerinckia sp. GAS462]SEB69501.1 methylated-DNA-[protein]-cysteine S-methyltransferase/AraC family transcriptional regulator, regulatory protein of adaptative response / methylated-DNA-[protein]-cysteine methyltransferase [Beijerinckia sp. 28-YEA-48]